MISMIELFDRDNVLCPEWLSYQRLEDDWLESTYSFEEGNHTWKLETPLKNVQISFNGEEYYFYAIEDGELVCLEIITEDHSIQY